MKKISIIAFLFVSLICLQTLSAKEVKSTKEKSAKSCCTVNSASIDKKDISTKKTAHAKGNDSCCQTKKKS